VDVEEAQRRQIEYPFGKRTAFEQQLELGGAFTAGRLELQGFAHILHPEENSRRLVGGILQRARVQQDCARVDPCDLMLDLELVEGIVTRQNFFEQLPQLWIPPFTVAEVVDRT